MTGEMVVVMAPNMVAVSVKFWTLLVAGEMVEVEMAPSTVVASLKMVVVAPNVVGV